MALSPRSNVVSWNGTSTLGVGVWAPLQLRKRSSNPMENLTYASSSFLHYSLTLLQKYGRPNEATPAAWQASYKDFNAPLNAAVSNSEGTAAAPPALTTRSEDVLAAPAVAPTGEVEVDPVTKNGNGEKKRKKHEDESPEERAERKRKKKEKKEKKEKRRSKKNESDVSD